MQPSLQWKSNQYYTTSVLIVTLVIQNVMHMCQLSIRGLPRSTSFSLSHKGTILRKQLLNKKCVYRISLQILSETFFILKRTERDLIENVYWSSFTVTFIPVRFQ